MASEDATTRAREQFYADIIIAAVEGGTNYWAYARNYHWSDENPSTTTVQLCDMEEHDEGTDKWQTLDMRAVENAFTLIRSRAVKLTDKTRSRYDQAYQECDAGDLDAEDADIIAQIALFGKLVYG